MKFIARICIIVASEDEKRQSLVGRARRNMSCISRVREHACASCAYHARTLQGFCTFCFHNLHTRGLFHRNSKKKNVGDKRKTWEISEKMSNVFRKISHVFWKRSNVFEERSEKLFPRILFMAPNVSKAPSKSLEISPIVQTLCAKDGNQYIFTSSSFGERFFPFTRFFFPEFRAVVTTL